jgi:hypothetical protein
MKTSNRILIGSLLFAATGWMAIAQSNEQPLGNDQRPPPPTPPLVAALDANRDGVINADEIAGAPTALAKLDKNSDGRLTSEEYLPRCGPPPPRPPMANGDETNAVRSLPPAPPHPIVSALDANHDGVIDAPEIANAAAALKTLDKNGDGEIGLDEVRPPWTHGPPPDQMTVF